MANRVCSSCGSTSSQSDESKKRIIQAFDKDYDMLFKFLEMMRSATRSVDDFNDKIIEKHNESVSFLKTAIFQAQSNVTDEIVRQREATAKTKFVCLKKGLKPNNDGALAYDSLDAELSSDESEVQPFERGPVGKPGGIMQAQQPVAASIEKPRNIMRVQQPGSAPVENSQNMPVQQPVSSPVENPRNVVQVQQPTSINPKFLNSLRRVTSKSTIKEAAEVAAALTFREEPPPQSNHRNICSSANVFESLAKSSGSKARNAISVDPRRSLLFTHSPQHQPQSKRPASASFSVAPPKKVRPMGLARSYEIGTVVLAKYGKYSFWPAIVVKRPEFSLVSEDCIHVMFWEGKETKMKTSCADVHYTMVRPWTDRESAHELVPKNRRRKDWNESVDLAEEMVLLTPEERFWKMILIEEKFELEIEYRPESSNNNNDKKFPKKGDVVVVGKDTFYPGVVTREELFHDNLRRDIYYVNSHLHVSFMEENTHGWYPSNEVWILGKNERAWPIPKGAAGQKIRKSMEVAREVLKMPREQRFTQIGQYAMQ